MEFLELKDISERFMDLINPTSPEKIVHLGKCLGLEPGRRVIDFGCGYGEVLCLWGQHFGVSGLGIDIRESACQRARQKLAAEGLDQQIEIVCGSGDKYRFEPRSYDAAVCLGASFIWNGFAPAIRAMHQAVRPDGKLAIGEPYWKLDDVPKEFREQQSDIHYEPELLELAWKEGYDFEAVIRASQDDWDRYESSNWAGFLRWIEANLDHPDRRQVIDALHDSQVEYTHYVRPYFGWAIYLLSPTYLP